MSDKENQNVTIEEFFEFLKTYLDEKQIAFVKKAYDFAAKMHADQKRRSGEPYIIHPIQVANILAVYYSSNPGCQYPRPDENG